MSARVNLLPARYVERVMERRRAGLTAGALVALLALLGLAVFLQRDDLERATAARDTEQARTGQLQVRRNELLPVQRQAGDIAGGERLLAAAMGTQVSWAELFASLSMNFPPDASLTSLTLESRLRPFTPTPPAEPGDEDAVIGKTTLKGYSVQQFAPGLHRALRLLASVAGVSEPRLQIGEVAQIEQKLVTTFDGTAFIDAAVLTGRYAEGLPPELDVELPPFGGATSGTAEATR